MPRQIMYYIHRHRLCESKFGYIIRNYLIKKNHTPMESLPYHYEKKKKSETIYTYINKLIRGGILNALYLSLYQFRQPRQSFFSSFSLDHRLPTFSCPATDYHSPLPTLVPNTVRTLKSFRMKFTASARTHSHLLSFSSYSVCMSN